MYRKLSSGWLKHLDFEILDILCMEVAFYLAYYIRHGTFEYKMSMYNRLAFILALIDIAVVFFSNNYKNIIQRTKWVEMFSTLRLVTEVELLLLLYTYIMQESQILSRQVFLLSWGLSFVFCTGIRLIWKKILRNQLTKPKNQANMLIITSSSRMLTLTESLKEKAYRGFKISAAAMLHDGEKSERIDANITLLYGKDKMLDYIRQEVVDEVYIDFFTDPAEISELTDLFLSMGVTVHIGTGFLPEGLPNRIVEQVGGETVFTSSLKMAREYELFIKRVVDIIGSVFGVILTALLFLFVAPAIKIASPGPVFFKQERIGKNGRTFKLYKFRTMVVDAEAKKEELMAQNEMEGQMFKIEHDPRIIGANNKSGKGLGHFLRSTSLDEFPQFFNVLKGDMSLVGTRPPTVEEFEKYDLHHKIRLSMKPGITGVWQVSGRNEIKNFEDIVKLDSYYIREWNLGLDLKILIKTVGVLFTGR